MQSTSLNLSKIFSLKLLALKLSKIGWIPGTKVFIEWNLESIERNRMENIKHLKNKNYKIQQMLQKELE